MNHKGRAYLTTVNGDDYTDEERLFMVAMDRWKRANHQPFPSWRNVLGVIHALGYTKPPLVEPMRVTSARVGASASVVTE